MNETFELKGQWCLPSNPKNAAYGIAKFDPYDGCTLELLGTFSGDLFEHNSPDQDIIWGVTHDSKSITLYKCFVTFQGGTSLKKGQSTGNPITKYYANFIFEGALLQKEEMLFDKLSVEFFNLAQWLGSDGFIYDTSNVDRIKKREYLLHYKLPEPINFSISSTLSGCFNITSKMPGWSRYNESQTISQLTELNLESKIELKFEDFLEEMRKFQNFLTLALYSGTYPLRITLSRKGLETDLGPEFGDQRFSLKKINVYCKSIGDKKSDNVKHHFQMLFEYSHIKDIFQDVYQKWNSLHIRLEPAFNILFEQFYNSHRFSENSFLNLAQAIETFHSRMHESTNKMPKEAYEKMKLHLIEVSSPEYHKWLNDIFPFGNMPTLQQRLDYMVDNYWNSLMDKIVVDKKEFTKNIKKSRNYYTHYALSEEKKVHKGFELYDLAQPLKIILCIAILRNIGFSKELIDSIFENGFIGFR